MAAHRKQHKKSKNGCVTCKRRRIKCDETKPICLRCTKTGIKCQYHDPSDKTFCYQNKNEIISTTYTIPPPPPPPHSLKQSKIYPNEEILIKNEHVPKPALPILSTNNQNKNNLISANTKTQIIHLPPISPIKKPITINHSPPVVYLPSIVLTQTNANSPNELLNVQSPNTPPAPQLHPPQLQPPTNNSNFNMNNILIGYKDFHDEMNLKILNLVKFKLLDEFCLIKNTITNLYFIESNEMAHHSINSILFIMLFHNSINSYELNFNFTPDIYISLSKIHFDKLNILHTQNDLINSNNLINIDKISINSIFLSLILKAIYHIANPNHKMTSKQFLSIFKSLSILKIKYKNFIEEEFNDINKVSSIASSLISPPPSSSSSFSGSTNSILPVNIEDIITIQIDEISLSQSEINSLLKFTNKMKYSINLNSNDLITLLINLFEDIDNEFINLIHKNEPKSLILMGYAIHIIQSKIKTKLFNQCLIFKDELDFILFKLNNLKATHWKLWLTPILQF